MIEFDSRKQKERRKTPCFIEKDRRKSDERREKAARDLEKKNRKEFEQRTGITILGKRCKNGFYIETTQPLKTHIDGVSNRCDCHQDER